MKKNLLLYLTILISTAVFAQIETIVAIDATSGTGPTQSGQDTYLESVGFTRSSGITASGNSVDAFDSKDWDGPTDLSGAIASENYVQWSVSAISSFSVTISRIRIRLKRNQQGPTNFNIVYSLDGFSTAGTPLSTSPRELPTNTVSDFIFSSFTPITSTIGGTITFRLYAYNAGQSGGQLAIQRNAGWTDYGITAPGVTMGGSTTFDGLIFNGLVWSPQAPTKLTGDRNTLITEGTVVFQEDVEVNDLIVSENLTSPVNIVVFPAASITVNGNLISDPAANITLRSTSTDYADLIVRGNSSGNVIYQRQVNGTSIVGENDLISSPVVGETFGNLEANSVNLVEDPADNSRKLFGPFDKATADYLIYDTDTDANVILESGVGYRAASTDFGNFNFAGSVLTTDLSVPIEVSGPDFQIWNLIGNPYTSHIDVQTFLTQNNLQFDPECAGIYGYDSDASDGWTIWNLAFAEASDEPLLITPGQGFYVASVSGGGNIIFSEASRRVGDVDDFIPNREKENDTKALRISASINSENYNTDFFFSPNASLGFDLGYDAAVFDLIAPSKAIYSHLIEDSANNDIAIQSIHPDNLSKAIIPLGVNAPAGSQITISINRTTLDDSVKIYLEDKQTQSQTLLNQSDYTFTTSSNISGIGRFYISFSSQTLSTDDAIENNLSIYFDKTEGSIHIDGNLRHSTSAKLYDIQGRLISQKNLEINQSSNKLYVENMAKGIYIVQISDNLKEFSKKIILR